jgi:cellobiose-specific phosphotransferase system component IIC
MRRLIIYILAAASLPIFSQFQEAITYREGLVIHEARIYGQTLGIEIAISVAVLLAAAMLFDGRLRCFRFSALKAVVVGLFALPALWNHWSVSRFGGSGSITEITAGTGGPLASGLFLAAAAAFVVVELYFELQPPDERRTIRA